MAAKKRSLPSAEQLDRARREGWEDWIVTRQDEIAVARGCYFDAAAAEGTRRFFAGLLTHGKAPFAGLPFELAEWQYREIIGPVYGWKMADGTRRYMSAFVFMPKKNGKTQLCAGVALRELFDQPGARVFMAAVSREQLTIDGCFDEAAGMVERSEILSGRLDVRRGTARIVDPARNSFIAAMATSAGSSQGKNASALIMDELHEWKDRAYFDSLLYSDTARVNSSVWMITTAGDEITSLCYEEYERACRIRDGKDLTIDHLPVVYEAPKGADWDDLNAWKIANPNYGVTLPERKIIKAIEQASNSPQRIAALKRYRLNIWTQAKDSWIDQTRWDELPEMDESLIAGLPCYGGLDLANVHDFAAFARAWRIDGLTFFRVRLWMPEGRVTEKAKSDSIPLEDWIARGFVTPTPGDEIDFEFVRREILELNAETPIIELGYDRWNAAHVVNQQLAAEDGLKCVEVPQNMATMGPVSAEFERIVTAGNVRHEQNPALGWMVGNAITVTDSNENFRPVKKRAKGRIDGLIACLIAQQRLSVGNAPTAKSYYDTHEAAEFI
jgi:phage terminase large subunit-like protein